MLGDEAVTTFQYGILSILYAATPVNAVESRLAVQSVECSSW